MNHLDRECLEAASSPSRLLRFQARTLAQADRGLWAVRAARNPQMEDGRGWQPYELLLGIALGMRLQLAALEIEG